MKRTKPNEQHLHPFIEPGKLAKDAIRSVGAEILQAAPPNLEQCADNVRRFAAEAKIDLFTWLQTSPHPGLKQMGERQLFLAAAWAAHTAQDLDISSKLYINEAPSLPLHKRNALITDFIITRKELGWRVDEFLERPERAQAFAHIERFNRMCIQQVVLISQMAQVYSAPQNKMRLPPKDYTDPMIQGANRGDIVALDVNALPKLIGIGFVHCVQELASLRQALTLQGMPQGAIDAKVKGFRDAFVVDFGTPMTPARFTELVAARNKLDTLDLTGTGH